jgi:hypothetical protein
MGLLRGPFTGHQMQSWFECGFFPMIMRLKSEVEPNFRPLGEYISLFGNQFFCLPPSIFLGSRIPPPFYAFPPSYGADMLPPPSWLPGPNMERENKNVGETVNDLSNLSLHEEKPQDIKDITIPTIPIIFEEVKSQPSEPSSISTLLTPHKDSVEVSELPKIETELTATIEETSKKQPSEASLQQPPKSDLRPTDKVKLTKFTEPVSKTPGSLKGPAEVKAKSWNVVRPEAGILSLAEIQRTQLEYQKARKSDQQETVNKTPKESKSLSGPPLPWTRQRHADEHSKPTSLEQIQKEQEKELWERNQREKQLINESIENNIIPAPVGWSKIGSSSSSSISSSKPRSFLDIQREQTDQSKLSSTPSPTTMADILRGGSGRHMTVSKAAVPWTTPLIPQVSHLLPLSESFVS